MCVKGTNVGCVCTVNVYTTTAVLYSSDILVTITKTVTVTNFLQL